MAKFCQITEYRCVLGCVLRAAKIHMHAFHRDANNQSILPRILLHFTNLPWELNDHCIFQVVLEFGGAMLTDTYENVMFIQMCIAWEFRTPHAFHRDPSRSPIIAWGYCGYPYWQLARDCGSGKNDSMGPECHRRLRSTRFFAPRVRYNRTRMDHDQCQDGGVCRMLSLCCANFWVV